MDIIKRILSGPLALLFPFQLARPTATDNAITALGYSSIGLFVALWAVNRLHWLKEPYIGYSDAISLVCVGVYLVGFVLSAVRLAAIGTKLQTQSFGAQIRHVAKMIGLYMFLPVAVVSALMIGLLFFLHRL